MKKVIWKFKLNDFGLTTLNVFADAEILSIGNQEGYPVAWVLLDPDKPRKQIIIQAVFTRQPFDPTGCEFIGTVQVGHIVSHFFKTSFMKNHVTPETAQKLKEAGFPQLKIDKSEFFGQDDFAARFLVGAKGTFVLEGEYFFVDYDKKEIILLPDAPDILMELGSGYILRPWSLDEKFACRRDNGEKYWDNNPAEACAAAWLAKNAKG